MLRVLIVSRPRRGGKSGFASRKPGVSEPPRHIPRNSSNARPVYQYICRACARALKNNSAAKALPGQRHLTVGQPARGVHDGATAPRRHHRAAREGAPRLGDVLGVLLLPYGHERPQRRPRSRGLELRYTTRPRTSHDVVGLFRARAMGASHRRAGAAATSITSPPAAWF